MLGEDVGNLVRRDGPDPGGVAASREFIVASSFLEPGAENTVPAWNAFANLVSANGGHPNLGRELKSAFLDTGSSDVRATASFDIFSTSEDVAFLHAFIMDWFYEPEIIGAATKYGLATPRAVRRVAARPRRVEKLCRGRWGTGLWRGNSPQAPILTQCVTPTGWGPALAASAGPEARTSEWGPIRPTRLDGRQNRGMESHILGVPSPYGSILRHGDGVAQEGIAGHHHDLLHEATDEGRSGRCPT